MKNQLRRRQNRQRQQDARRGARAARRAEARRHAEGQHHEGGHQAPLVSRPISAEFPDDWVWCAWCRRFFQQKHARTDFIGAHEGCPFCERAGFYAAIFPWPYSGWTSSQDLRVGLRSDGPPEAKLPLPKITPQVPESPERIAEVDAIFAQSFEDPAAAARAMQEFQKGRHPDADAIREALDTPQVYN